MTRLPVLRRPLLLLGAVAVVLGAYAGGSAALDARHEHQRVARVQHWQVRAVAVSQAHNAVLLPRLEAALPSYLVRTAPAPHARPWTLGVGTWTTTRTPAAVVADVAQALRRAGFTAVSVTGTSVRAALPEGQVRLRAVAGADGRGTELHAVLAPAVPPCC